MKSISLYVHVPFCKRRCAYCTFYHVPHVERFEGALVDALIDEFRSVTEELGAVRLETVFLGGGTPSVLSARSLDRMFEVFTPYIQRDAEVTVEANPEDVTPEVLDHLAARGVNRLSVGIQSMESRALNTLKRCGADANARALTLVADRFDNFNIDLVLGTPGGSIDEVRRTLARVSEWKAPHYSVYCLEPGGVMKSAEIDRFFAEVDGEQAAEQYLHVCEFLATNGYDHYEVSNFARPGFASRHNRAYWSGSDYVGIGPAAHSFLDGERYHNAASIEGYVAGGGRGVRQRETRGVEERRTERLMLALRTSRGLAVDQADCGPAVLQDLVDSRLAERRGERVVLTDRGFLLLDEILLRVAS